MSSITWKDHDEHTWLGTGLFTKRSYKIVESNFCDTYECMLYACGSTAYLFSEDTLELAKSRLEFYEGLVLKLRC